MGSEMCIRDRAGSVRLDLSSEPLGTGKDGRQEQIEVLCRIDTVNEVEYFKAGGILHYVLRQLIAG